MPVYEYVCAECSHRFETLRAMRAADDPIQCPQCSSFETSRALSIFCAHGSGGVIAGAGQAVLHAVEDHALPVPAEN